MKALRLLSSVVLTISVVALSGWAADTSGAVAPGVEQTSESLEAPTYGGPHLLWQNTSTGQISAWLLKDTQVTGTKSLSGTCGASNGCSSSWRAVDTAGSTILWDNPQSGVLQAWRFGSSGQVSLQPAFTWQCAGSTGCSSAWRPIGRLQLNIPAWPVGGLQAFEHGLLWHNASTGELSVWEVGAFDDGNEVLGKVAISGRCGASDGCSAAWRAVLTADFDEDGFDDILWHNATTGELSVWLLNGTSIKGYMRLDWPCSSASGCASSWSTVDTADVNGDGHTDLTWFNPKTGVVSSWLLNGRGHVLSKSDFNWTCGAGCSNVWKPLGYVWFPYDMLH